ncbi:MAG: sulfatase-like hydrolase/transferase, partial [Pirellulales bacterium]
MQLIATLCWLFLLSAGIVHAESPGGPNVILMMADDLGWGDPGFNGNQTIATPNLDAMASAGLRFERFYSGAPVCSPTRGSCLTGRHPYRYGVWGANRGHLTSAELTLAELLSKLGYRTGHFGKWHLGTLSRWTNDSNRGGLRGIAHFSPPWLHGFDVCFSSEARLPTWDPMLGPLGRIPVTWKPLDPLQAAPFGTYYWNELGERITDNLQGDDSRVIMDRAVPFIEQSVREGDPFFAVIWFHAPHLPVVAGEAYTRRYAAHDLYHRNYYGCITALDEQVGRLRARLRSLEVADRTMVWFASDNGPVGGKRVPDAPGS